MAALDLTSFDHAWQRLAEGLIRYQQDTSDLQIRDGLIQRFEFTYEISHKMLKRYLEKGAPSPPEMTNMVFADLIRAGNEQGLLLGTWADWKRYRELRSRTSHTYQQETALAVVLEIPCFLEEARYLLEQLHARNTQHDD